MSLENIDKDGGLLSRKWLLIIGSMLLVTGVAVLSGFLMPIQTVFSTFCGTIVSLCGLYIGGNGAVKYIFAKHTADMHKVTQNAPQAQPAALEVKPKTPGK